MRPVTVEVITYAPTAFFHCQHCELTFGRVGLAEKIRRDQAATSLPEDLGREFERLVDWADQLVRQYGPRVHLRVVDAASVEGVLHSLRHRVFRYPAVLVDGRVVVVGADPTAAEGAVAAAVRGSDASAGVA
ncbi:MAG TPA: DUF1525 domain-containing protein [Candidatus Binatia bacterium]|nr:DUF1525 domain-containing protein [Candidatus Binatia bacterium]